ncbi:Smr/MutS family protein [Xanthobacter agilis]|uniref:DNA-nicking Smr family endonuclease n=1 Tax=Xanthobacter agilis TaxID=47492 RepID=A0ABU0L8N9_XANAG|nr:Smr/MutS family protein [Xanthobacter agilis]MDQ0503503.1 DNA-nicking Smr family endonuclease [Xanthobacter agilis]
MTPRATTRRGRRRLLSGEERALWAHVVREVKPLRPQPPTGDPAEGVAPPVDGTPAPRPTSPPTMSLPTMTAKPAPAVPPSPPPLAPLEHKARRRLSRGAEVDARIDLHGLTQTAAHRRLRLFLVEAQALGHGVVLVITGKGDPDRLGGLFGEGRGVLRRAVPLWLAEPEMRSVVVGFEAAGRRHGGEGALYVRIRRRRDRGMD